MTLFQKIFGKKEKQIDFNELIKQKQQKPTNIVNNGIERKEKEEENLGQGPYEIQKFDKRLELIIVDENLKDSQDRTELKEYFRQSGVVTYVVATSQEYEIHSKIYKPEKNVIIFGEYKHIAPKEDIKKVFGNNGKPGEASVCLSLQYAPNAQDYLARLSKFNEQTGLAIKVEELRDEVVTSKDDGEKDNVQSTIVQPIIIEADEPKVEMPKTEPAEAWKREVDSIYTAPPPQEDFVGKMLAEEKKEFENLVNEKTGKTTLEIKPKPEIDMTKARKAGGS